MNIWDIAKKVGSAALQVALPGTGSAIIAAVNEFLPEGEGLPSGATGEDISKAVLQLNPEQRTMLMSKQFDVDIAHIQESHSTVRVMLESDAKNPHTTRPYIAKGAFHVIALVVVVTVLTWAFGVVKGDSEMIEAVMGGWQFILAVIGPLVTLLWAYFGILKQEHKQKLNAANGEVATGILETVVNRFKK